MFKAQNINDQKMYALKYQQVNDPKLLESVKNEIAINKYLREDDENAPICQIHDVYLYRERIWMFMDLMKTDLHSYIQI